MPDAKLNNPSKILTWLKIAIAILLVLCVCLIIVIAVLATKLKRNENADVGIDKRGKGMQYCTDEKRLPSADVTSSGIFDDLSESEMMAVRNYIMEQALLNATLFENATVNSNYIHLIELQQPPKLEALKHLDNKGPKPERKARVVMFNGGKAVPDVMEYLVGPAGKPSKHELKIAIAFHKRPIDSVQYKRIERLILNATKHADRLLRKSYDGYSYFNCSDLCLEWSNSLSGALRSGQRKSWVFFMRDLQGLYLHPVGFDLLIDCPGSNVNQWRVEKVFYHNQTFDSVDDLMGAYDRGTLSEMFLPAPADKGTSAYSTYQRRGDPQPAKPQRGPRQFEPDGKRYAVNGRHIDYMGWSFEFRARSSSGVQIFDVRFKGERIVFELSMQEAAAFYSGFSPMQMFTDYLDTAWGMGTSIFELIPGVDCPDSATFFDIKHFFDGATPLTYKNAICVFELNTGIPLRRHYDNNFEGGFNFVGGLPTYALVLRYISSPYNYDYVFDYMFYPNGVIEVKISTTGYIQAIHWINNEVPYGSEVHRHVAGSLHDHMINYKVDLDVAGTDNSYQTIDFEVENITNPWYPGYFMTQKVVRRRTKDTEQEALYTCNFDHPKYLNFISESNTTKQGQPRGYRIQIDSPMKQLYPASKPLMKGAQWSLHQMAVTKHKETEERSSSIYNQQDMFEPVVEFQKFYQDNDNIREKDLVAWVTVGLMHLPHTEDVPTTATAGNTARFFIRPYNYFDEDPSMASSDAVLIEPADAKSSGVKVNRFGTPQGSYCTPKEKPLNYTGTYGN